MALVAMSLRAVLPTGYMLANDDGHVVVAICGGGAMALDLGKSEHGKKSQHEAPCPYTTAAHAGPAPGEMAALSPRSAFVAVSPARLTPRPGLGLAAPPPPATGPPLSA